jgi:hypothetical protein
VTAEGAELDLWMSDPDKYLLHSYDTYLWNPAKAVRIFIDRDSRNKKNK